MYELEIFEPSAWRSLWLRATRVEPEVEGTALASECRSPRTLRDMECMRHRVGSDSSHRYIGIEDLEEPRPFPRRGSNESAPLHFVFFCVSEVGSSNLVNSRHVWEEKHP